MSGFLHKVVCPTGSPAASPTHLPEPAERARDTFVPQGSGPDGQYLQQRLQRQQQQHSDSVWTTATASGPATAAAATTAASTTAGAAAAETAATATTIATAATAAAAAAATTTTAAEAANLHDDPEAADPLVQAEPAGWRGKQPRYYAGRIQVRVFAKRYQN